MGRGGGDRRGRERGTRRPMSSFDASTAVRLGIINPRPHITEQDILNEIEHLRFGSSVDAVFIEVVRGPHPTTTTTTTTTTTGANNNDDNDNRDDKKSSSDDKNVAEDKKKTNNADDAHNNNNNKVVAHATSTEEGYPKFDKGGRRIEWARIFMANTDYADALATEFALPGQRWRDMIVQRLPIVDLHKQQQEAEDQQQEQAIMMLMNNDNNNNNMMGPAPALLPPSSGGMGPVKADIPQIVVCDTAEGYISFMSTELYHTLGVGEYLEGREKGRIIRRLICKHFDPLLNIDCRYGSACTFVHIRKDPMERLLRIQSFKTRLRVPRRLEDVQLSTWVMNRQEDTLVVRDLPENVKQEQLDYMFSGCQGFLSAKTRSMAHDQYSDRSDYGVVRFANRRDAMNALTQTFKSGLSVNFYGVLEDLRLFRVKEVFERTATQQHQQGGGDNNNNSSDNGNKNKQQQQFINDDDLNFYRGHRGGGGGNQPKQSSSTRGGSLLQSLPQGPGRGQQEESAGSRRQRGGDRDDDNNNNDGEKQREGGTSAASRNDPISDGGVPPNDADRLKPSADDFPPLPEGWDWGFSRRQNRYYFFETKASSKTAWLHPNNQKSYSAGGESFEGSG